MSDCQSCGQPWSDHYTEIDDTQMLGLWSPVPAYQEPMAWLVCPFAENNE